MEFSKFPRNVTFWPYFEDARGRVARRIRESTKLLGNVRGRGTEGARRQGMCTGVRWEEEARKSERDRGSGTQRATRRGEGYVVCVRVCVRTCMCASTCTRLLACVYIPEEPRRRGTSRVAERSDAGVRMALALLLHASRLVSSRHVTRRSDAHRRGRIIM